MATHDTGYDPELYARRRSSFGDAAAAYAEYRPDYPEAAVRWALEPATDASAGPGSGSGSGSGGPLHVLDLAAGTGKLSLPVLALGHRVTAVEPDPKMLAELRRRVPEATALAGTAEEIPLPDASVDAVVVGQALHWFDQDRALPEIARVLRPGGPLTALSNADDDRVEWVAGLAEVSPSSVSYRGWATRPGRLLQPHPAFSPATSAEFPHTRRLDADALIAAVGTHSHLLVLESAERARTEQRIRDYLASRPETSSGAFDLPLVTCAHRSVRLAGPTTG